MKPGKLRAERLRRAFLNRDAQHAFTRRSVSLLRQWPQEASAMKTWIKSAIALPALLALGGCVYGPDYGYVRGDGYYGDAYYGAPVYYDDYSYGPGYYGGYYGPSLGFYYNDGYYGGRHRHWNNGGHWNSGGGSWQGGNAWRGGSGRWSGGVTPSSVPRPSYNRAPSPSSSSSIRPNSRR
jgi:hypothetical protein